MNETEEKTCKLRMHFDIPCELAPELQLMAVLEQATKSLIPGTTLEDVATRARVGHWYQSRHTIYTPPTR